MTKAWPSAAGGGAENTDPNRQPPTKASELLDAAVVSAAAQADESRYLHVRPLALLARSLQRRVQNTRCCCCCVLTRPRFIARLVSSRPKPRP